MAVGTENLDRFTFDFIQLRLAEAGYKEAAGHMVEMKHDYRPCFKEKSFNIRVNPSAYTEEQIQEFVDAVNQAKE